MELILDTEAAKYKKIVNSLVLHKLVSTSNPLGTHIRSQLCARTACSNAILGEIDSEARRVSSAAVDSAFKDLRASVFDNKALEESGLDRQGGLTNPRAGSVGQGGGRVPAPSPHIGGGGTHDLDGVVVQPAAFEKAAESGMGYQPVYILI
jgi:hypothetical protein